MTDQYEQTVYFQGHNESLQRQNRLLLSENSVMRWALNQIVKGKRDPQEIARDALARCDD